MNLAPNITVIPAKRTIGTQKSTEEKQKTRVAAYCRASPDRAASAAATASPAARAA